MSVSLPISPIPIDSVDVPPNTVYEYDPDNHSSNLNCSVSSSNSSNNQSDSDVAHPSSDIETKLAEDLRIDLTYCDLPHDELHPEFIHKQLSASNFYNNPVVEAQFLEFSFVYFLALSMTGNLLHWIKQTDLNITRSI